MKVKLSNKSNFVPFNTLMVGDCFKYNNAVFIKVKPSFENDNVFNCIENECYSLCSDSMVVPCLMELVEVKWK